VPGRVPRLLERHAHEPVEQLLVHGGNLGLDM
jgi:hypothetical protein